MKVSTRHSARQSIRRSGSRRSSYSYPSPSGTTTTSNGSSSYSQGESYGEGLAAGESKAFSFSTGGSGPGAGGGVFFFALLLLILATWKPFWSPLIDTAWSGTSRKTTVPVQLVIGGLVFAWLLSLMAKASKQSEQVAIWMLVAMWLVFIMFNGGPTINAIFDAIPNLV